MDNEEIEELSEEKEKMSDDNQNNKKENVNYNKVFIISAIVIIILLIGFLCFQYFVNNSNTNKNNTEKNVTLVTDTSGLKLNDSISDYIETSSCKKSTIKTNYSIQINEGKLLVTNNDTMENFTIDKFANSKVLIQFSYDGECDKKIYVILTYDGQIYYTNDDITTISDVKNIEEKFYLLDTALRFNSLSVAKVNDEIRLYGKTSTDNIYIIDLR